MSRLVKRTAWAVLVLFVSLAACLAALYRPDLSPESLKARYAAPPSRFVDVGGLKVHYRDEGQGPALVLLHGAGSSLQTWDAWVRDLARDHRVVRLDLPGFGLTGPNATKDYSMDWYVPFLKAFLDRLDVPRAALAGNSFGGRIALEFACAHPDRVSKLVLIDSSGYASDARKLLALRMADLPLLGRILKYDTPRFFVAMNVRETYGDPRRLTDEAIDRYYDMIRCRGNRETFGMLHRASGAADSSGHIRALRLPTLILWGSEDRTLSPSLAARFHRDIPNSRVVIYQGAGHMPMEEIPEQTLRDVRAFL